jgi:F-type H+-transporting ATPase subunit b
MEIVSTIGLITINETMIVQVLSFLLLVFVLNRIMFRPLRKTMAERDDVIEGIRQDIGQVTEELGTVTAEAAKLEDATKKAAFQIRADLEQKAQEEAGAVLKSAGKEMDLLKQRAEADVAKAIEVARGSLADESERLTVAIMEKLLDRRLTQ